MVFSSVGMGGSSKEDLGRRCLHSSSSRGSTSNKGEQPITVVKVRRVRKAGQEGVKSEEIDIRRCADVKMDSEAFAGSTVARLETLKKTLMVEEECEVEVIKKEGRGKQGEEVGRCRKQKGQRRNHVEKVVDYNPAESELVQCKRETKVLETHEGDGKRIGLEKESRSEIIWPHLGAIEHQNDLWKITCQDVESDIDAKLKELKLKSPNTGSGFKEELAQDIQAVMEAEDVISKKVEMTSEKVEVEVEDMTSKDYYYDPLGHYAAHEEALKDEPRMLIWQQVS